MNLYGIESAEDYFCLPAAGTKSVGPKRVLGTHRDVQNGEERCIQVDLRCRSHVKRRDRFCKRRPAAPKMEEEEEDRTGRSIALLVV